MTPEMLAAAVISGLIGLILFGSPVFMLFGAARASKSNYACEACGEVNDSGWDTEPMGYCLAPACTECGEIQDGFGVLTPPEVRSSNA